MKILLTQKISMLSGSEWHILQLSTGLQNKGHEVHFLGLIESGSIEQSKELIDMFKERGIKVHSLVVNSDYSLSLYRKISKLIKEEKYDFVHSHLVRTDFILSMTKALFLPDLYLISTQHGFDEDYQIKYGFNIVPLPLNKYILASKFTQRFINANIAISHSVKKLFVGHNIYPAEKSQVIHYGFDFKNVEYDKDKSKYRKGKKQLLIVGRLVEWKGHKFVLNILPELIEKYGDDLCLTIVGKGIYQEELKQHTQKLGLEKYVHFEGFSTKVHDYISNSDIVLIPSMSEGFCVVLMETYHSMAPLMSFDVPALNENIFHRKTGMLSPPYDTQSLKNNIIEILDNPELGEELKKNGKEYLETYLNLERMTDETIAFYNSKILSKS